MRNKLKQSLLLLIIILPLIYSCASGPVVVPEDLTPQKIIQSAQEATDLNRYRIAIGYYEALLERFGTIGEYYCIGLYEIAFIHYKQRRFAEARQGFEYLVSLYEMDVGNTLPRRFKVLAELLLVKITERGH